MSAVNPVLKFRGTVRNAVFIPYKPKSREQWLRLHEGKDIEEVLQPAIPPVTTDQHGYLRGGIIRVACMNSDRFAGWEEDEIYDYFVDRYFTVTIVKTSNGKSVEFKKRLSMATCGKERASEFIRRVVQDLAEDTDCPIIPPLPEDFVLNQYSSKNRESDKPKDKKVRRTQG